MMLRLAMGIVVLALPPHGTSALTSAIADALSDDARLLGSPATPAVWEKSVAPEDVVRAPAVAVPMQDRTLSGNPLWAIPLIVLSGTRERPIFSPSRRPPAAKPNPIHKPVASAPKPQEPEHPQLSLVGTIATSYESFGIFLNPSTKAALRLKTGDYYQGWKLGSVQARQATLEKDQQTVTLTLPQPGSGQPANDVPSLSGSGRLLSALSPARRERSH
ncbi:hypothetical protein [Afipia sp. GAS231]|uniref:hypothetical protein n=1 Tax=Afipia sp. GAS231 TaxID=1882747 RepID=UPI0012F78EE2|nr:hypothetical protein [Afipia sp. GAS231]